MREADKIEHLLRRTGFCCTPAQRKQAHREGYEATVESILQRSLAYRLQEGPPPVVAPALVLPVTFLTFAEGILWWMRTLARTVSPLNERLTLFWHRHFATSGAKVFRPGWMFQQNQTFREYGMGSFSELLGQMVKDPALLKWLDADDNPADHPNENLARELMELFTLGIGHFTEHDVKELAKLTTGKRLTFGGRTPAQPKGAYTGPVSLLGFKGQTDLTETASRLAVHEATAKRLVDLLWSDFVAGSLAAGERAQLAALWSKTRGNVAVVLRRIFHSPSFFCAPRQRVLSPIR